MLGRECWMTLLRGGKDAGESLASFQKEHPCLHTQQMSSQNQAWTMTSKAALLLSQVS